MLYCIACYGHAIGEYAYMAIDKTKILSSISTALEEAYASGERAALDRIQSMLGSTLTLKKEAPEAEKKQSLTHFGRNKIGKRRNTGSLREAVNIIKERVTVGEINTITTQLVMKWIHPMRDNLAWHSCGYLVATGYLKRIERGTYRVENPDDLSEYSAVKFTKAKLERLASK